MPSHIRMHQIQSILRLFQRGTAIREICRITGLNRNTIRSYLGRFLSSGVLLEELQKLPDEELRAVIGLDDPVHTRKGRPVDERFGKLSSELVQFAAQLGKRGVTRSLLWAEYRQQYPQGYSYSQFCHHLSNHHKQMDATMVLPRFPGDQLQVDFAGKMMSYADPRTGEVFDCPVLICAMPYSHFIYAQALRSERQDEFLSALSRALTYLGAVPRSLKVDNMRVAVKRASRYEPVFTLAMEQFANHYDTTSIAARVRKPRDKASVEKAVDLTYKYVYAPLRNRIFTSLEALNGAILEQVNKVNDRLLTHRKVSRRQIYQQEEIEKMQPLPSSPFQIKNVTEGKVQRNYHVFLGEDKNQYSAPYNLIGRKLRVIYDLDTVELYDGLVRVAVHPRSHRKNAYTTLSEHMPERHQQHREYLGWDADTFRNQAQLIGPSTLQVIEQILASKYFQEQTFNRCLGVLRLAKRYGSERLEKACRYLSHLPQVSYVMVSNVLKNNIDLMDQIEQALPPPVHDQIRGPGNYY